MWKTGGCGGILPYDKAKVPPEICIRMENNSRFLEINYLLFVLALPFQISSYFFSVPFPTLHLFPSPPFSISLITGRDPEKENKKEGGGEEVFCAFLREIEEGKGGSKLRPFITRGPPFPLSSFTCVRGTAGLERASGWVGGPIKVQGKMFCLPSFEW